MRRVQETHRNLRDTTPLTQYNGSQAAVRLSWVGGDMEPDGRGSLMDLAVLEAQWVLKAS